MAIVIHDEQEFLKIGSGEEYPPGSGQIWDNQQDYELNADIDMSLIPTWYPTDLYGNFDGKGHTIRNLNKTVSSGGAMFGRINGIFQNVIFDNFQINMGNSNTTAMLFENVSYEATVANVGLINSSCIGKGVWQSVFTSNSSSFFYCCYCLNCIFDMQNTGAIFGGPSAKTVNCYMAMCTLSSDSIEVFGTWDSFSCYAEAGNGGKVFTYPPQLTDVDVPPRPDQFQDFKMTVEMQPTLADARANASIYFTGSGFSSSKFIPGWDFVEEWGIDPSINYGFPHLKFKPYVDKWVQVIFIAKSPTGFMWMSNIWTERGHPVDKPIPDTVPDDIEIVGWGNSWGLLWDFRDPVLESTYLYSVMRLIGPEPPIPPTPPTDDNLERRIAILRAVTLYSNTETYTPDYVKASMEDALRVFLEYTGRAKDPGIPVDSIVVDLCKDRINKMGLEGAQSTSEGGVSQTWAVDPMLLSRMRRYRLVAGMKE